MVSEQFGSSTTTVGAPPSNQHDVDLRFSISEQISAAVNLTFQKMQQTLIDHLSLSIDQAFQRFEARIARSLEQQDVSMNTLKNDQLKSQEERRSSISSLRDTEITKGFGGKGLVDVQEAREIMGRPGSTIMLTNPAPPDLFHYTEPTPSMPSYIYTTEYSTQQVFEVIPDRNSILIDGAFNTTLSTGQTYYSIDTTTVDNGSKMPSSVKYLNSADRNSDDRPVRDMNKEEKNTTFFCVVISVFDPGGESICRHKYCYNF